MHERGEIILYEDAYENIAIAISGRQRGRHVPGASGSRRPDQGRGVSVLEQLGRKFARFTTNQVVRRPWAWRLLRRADPAPVQPHRAFLGREAHPGGVRVARGRARLDRRAAEARARSRNRDGQGGVHPREALSGRRGRRRGSRRRDARRGPRADAARACGSRPVRGGRRASGCPIPMRRSTSSRSRT